MIWILFALFIVVQVLDIYTTVHVLLAGAREANPLMHWLMERIGMVPALIVGKAIVVAIVLAAVLYAPSTHLTLAVAIVDCLYAGACLHNYRIARGL